MTPLTWQLSPQFIEYLEYGVTVIFCLEMILRVIDLGFVIHPGSYLRDPWNVLDAVVVLVSILRVAVWVYFNYISKYIGILDWYNPMIYKKICYEIIWPVTMPWFWKCQFKTRLGEILSAQKPNRSGLGWFLGLEPNLVESCWVIICWHRWLNHIHTCRV